jgi:hypothetical protein
MPPRNLIRILAAVLVAGWACACAQAATLYAASARRADAAGGGHLYEIDPATAKSRDIGAILVDGKQPVGVRALAVHPKTHRLYALTADSPPRLAIIDPQTARARIVGELDVEATDINFDRRGRLYAWIAQSHRLATIDLSNAAVHPLATAGSLAEAGGGLAIDAHGTAYVAAAPVKGAIGRLDVRSGRRRGEELKLVGEPESWIDALTLSAEGDLLGAMRVGSTSGHKLVAINSETGVMRVVGDLPEAVEGLALAPDACGVAAQRLRDRMNVFGLAVVALLGLTLVAAFRARKLPRNEFPPSPA